MGQVLPHSHHRGNTFWKLLQLVWWCSLHLVLCFKIHLGSCFPSGDGKSMTVVHMRGQHCSRPCGVTVYCSSRCWGRRHLGCHSLSKMNSQQWWMMITLYIKFCDMNVAITKCDFLSIIKLFALVQYCN